MTDLPQTPAKGLYRGFEVCCPHCESWFEPEDFEDVSAAPVASCSPSAAQIDAAWEAFQNCPIDLLADCDDEKKKCLIAALKAALAAPVASCSEGGMIERCMDMLGDVPGETLEDRLERFISTHIELLANGRPQSSKESESAREALVAYRLAQKWATGTEAHRLALEAADRKNPLPPWYDLAEHDAGAGAGVGKP